MGKRVKDIYVNLVENGHFKKCIFCNRHMRTFLNQKWLITVRPELKAKTISDIQDHFQKNSSDLFEVTENYCQHCSKINHG